MNILEHLNKTQIKLIETKNYKKNLTIIHEGDFCSRIGIVLSGEISIVSYLADGSEIIYNTLHSDDIFGNNLIFSSSPYYKGNVITNTDCKIAFIDKKDLLKILKDNENFFIHYLKIQSDFGKQLNQKIKLLSISSAKERLLYYFHLNNNIIELNSISSLAKQLYLQRETLSRVLSKLEKEKLIKRDNNSIILL